MTSITPRPTLSLARTSKPRISFARLRQAARLFKGAYTPKSVRRHNVVQWLRAIELLGEKWLFANPIRREVK